MDGRPVAGLRQQWTRRRRSDRLRRHYTRVSTLEQGEHGFGLDQQRKDCQRLAEEIDAQVVETYEDRDSGAS
jgi:DNA invertase Pin-like site-specific DNA recombinase